MILTIMFSILVQILRVIFLLLNSLDTSDGAKKYFKCCNKIKETQSCNLHYGYMDIDEKRGPFCMYERKFVFPILTAPMKLRKIGLKVYTRNKIAPYTQNIRDM